MNTDTHTRPANRPTSSGADPGLRTPLRILVIGIALLAVAWCALTLASLLARGSGVADGSYSGVQTLEIDTGFESVDVVGSPDATKVTLERTYHWSLSRPAVGADQRGGVLRISSSCPFAVGIGCTGKVRLVVPAGLTVRSDTGDGRLTLRDLTGALTVTSSDGDVDAEGLTGDLSVEVKDGSVEARGLRSANVRARSADGDVLLSFVTPPSSVTGTSKDGSITVEVPRDSTAYDVSLSVQDGSQRVDVPTASGSSHRIRMSAADGSLTVVPVG
jgi:hypothetical protein